MHAEFCLQPCAGTGRFLTGDRIARSYLEFVIILKGCLSELVQWILISQRIYWRSSTLIFFSSLGTLEKISQLEKYASECLQEARGQAVKGSRSPNLLIFFKKNPQKGCAIGGFPQCITQLDGFVDLFSLFIFLEYHTLSAG